MEALSPAISAASEDENGSTQAGAQAGSRLAAFLAEYSAPAADNAPLSANGVAFTPRFDTPLPAFTTPYSRAFACNGQSKDGHPLMAVVAERGVIPRAGFAEAWIAHPHPALANIYAAGMVQTPEGRRYTWIAEQPRGQKLSDMLRERGQGLPESYIVEKILRPLTEALTPIAEREVTHGTIHPDTLYYDKGVQLLPVLGPCGALQHPWCGAPERLCALALGKGEGDGTADSYALGMLGLLLWLGRLPEPTEPLALAQKLAESGPYLYWVQSLQPPDMLRDLLRGTLQDQPKDRWRVPQLKQWAGGKRFGTVLPTTPRDAPRPYEVGGQAFFSYRALALHWQQHPERAVKEVFDPQLPRWIELNPKQHEKATEIARLTGNRERSPTETVARVSLLLDPLAPLRYGPIAATVDGLSAVLAEAFRSDNATLKQAMGQLIQSDIASSLYERDDENLPLAISQLIQTLQKGRMLLRSTSLGGGLERILYDINPQLPCLSPLVEAAGATTPGELLGALDRLARERAGNGAASHNAPMDRHIAGFLTSRMGVAKELKVHALAARPHFANHPELIGLQLLAMAQEKSGKTHHPGLSAWIAQRLLPLSEQLHHRKSRAALANALARSAKSGHLQDVLDVLITSGVLKQDEDGVQAASARYREIQARLKALSDGEGRVADATYMGRYMALVIAYIIGAISLYLHAGPYMPQVLRLIPGWPL